MSLQITSLPVETFTQHMENQTPIAFSRWGDGEWRIILQTHLDNPVFNWPIQRQQLLDILMSSPNYLLGMQRLAMNQMGTQIENLLQGTDIQWVRSDIFHHSSQENNWLWWKAFKKHPQNILVGPAYLKQIWPNVIETIPYVKGVWKFVWDETDELTQAVLDYVKDKEFVTVGFCASLASNIIIDRMHKMIPRHSYIDFGSVLDPLCDVFSRSYMRDPEFQERLRNG